MLDRRSCGADLAMIMFLSGLVMVGWSAYRTCELYADAKYAKKEINCVPSRNDQLQHIHITVNDDTQLPVFIQDRLNLPVLNTKERSKLIEIDLS
ncbi:hypothetical protein [Paenibacillus anseongense]|uniref:hypothetical protein n=1 Tax=Paenibacillus anseongense TaxID=2682845 RepID=UPI002DBB6103|nr:hypothetical protein [Paenibacillus anseongense]MEC0266717.1 hypothetical protein [Paenibacillus anseongense]